MLCPSLSPWSSPNEAKFSVRHQKAPGEGFRSMSLEGRGPPPPSECAEPWRRGGGRGYRSSSLAGNLTMTGL